MAKHPKNSGHNFAHTDHLDQGEGGAKQRVTGSQLDQGPQSGAAGQKASGSQHEANLDGSKPTGDHLTPHLPSTDANPGRGAGGTHIAKIDRTMEHGAAKSGSKETQQPSLANPKRKQNGPGNFYAHKQK